MDLRIDQVHTVAIDMNASIGFYSTMGLGLLPILECRLDEKRKQLSYAERSTTVIELAKPRDATASLSEGAWMRPRAYVGGIT
jgi:hypothetical protein